MNTTKRLSPSQEELQAFEERKKFMIEASLKSIRDCEAYIKSHRQYAKDTQEKNEC